MSGVEVIIEDGYPDDFYHYTKYPWEKLSKQITAITIGPDITIAGPYSWFSDYPSVTRIEFAEGVTSLGERRTLFYVDALQSCILEFDTESPGVIKVLLDFSAEKIPAFTALALLNKLKGYSESLEYRKNPQNMELRFGYIKAPMKCRQFPELIRECFPWLTL